MHSLLYDTILPLLLLEFFLCLFVGVVRGRFLSISVASILLYLTAWLFLLLVVWHFITKFW